MSRLLLRLLVLLHVARLAAAGDVVTLGRISLIRHFRASAAVAANDPEDFGLVVLGFTAAPISGGGRI